MTVLNNRNCLRNTCQWLVIIYMYIPQTLVLQVNIIVKCFLSFSTMPYKLALKNLKNISNYGMYSQVKMIETVFKCSVTSCHQLNKYAILGHIKQCVTITTHQRRCLYVRVCSINISIHVVPNNVL